MAARERANSEDDAVLQITESQLLSWQLEEYLEAVKYNKFFSVSETISTHPKTFENQ